MQHLYDSTLTTLAAPKPGRCLAGALVVRRRAGRRDRAAEALVAAATGAHVHARRVGRAVHLRIRTDQSATLRTEITAKNEKTHYTAECVAQCLSAMAEASLYGATT